MNKPFSMDKFVIRKRKPTNPIDEDEPSNNDSENSELLISSDLDYDAGLLSVEVSKPEKDFGAGSSETTAQHENNVKRNVEELFKKARNKSLTG